MPSENPGGFGNGTEIREGNEDDDDEADEAASRVTVGVGSDGSGGGGGGGGSSSDAWSEANMEGVLPAGPEGQVIAPAKLSALQPWLLCMETGKERVSWLVDSMSELKVSLLPEAADASAKAIAFL